MATRSRVALFVLGASLAMDACSGGVDYIGSGREPQTQAGSSSDTSGAPTDGGDVGLPTGGTAGSSGISGGGGGGRGGTGMAEEPYSGAFKVLILSTIGSPQDYTQDMTPYRHASIPDCQQMIADLGSGPMPDGTKPDTSFTMKVANDDLSEFTDENLKNYGMLFWCNPIGTVFSGRGAVGQVAMAAIQKFVENGGAWGGVHSASDFEKTNGFPWYTNTLLGAYWTHNDDDGTPGTIVIQDEFLSHTVVRGLDAKWSTRDEWFYMNRDIDPDSGFKILAKLAKDQRPVIWVKELGTNLNGRMFYTIRGHNKTVYQEPAFRKLILNGILWATHRLD